jgi:ribonuclease I
MPNHNLPDKKLSTARRQSGNFVIVHVIPLSDAEVSFYAASSTDNQSKAHNQSEEKDRKDHETIQINWSKAFCNHGPDRCTDRDNERRAAGPSLHLNWKSGEYAGSKIRQPPKFTARRPPPQAEIQNAIRHLSDWPQADS